MTESTSIETVHEHIQQRKVRLLEGDLANAPQLVLKTDADGRTPLMWALSETQDAEAVSIVLKAARAVPGFDVNVADGAGFTALHIAASLGEAYVSQVLAFDPIIDSRTTNLQTPLFLAVSKKQVGAARLLIERGASVRAKDKRQVTVLQRAAAVGSLELVELLLDRGAPVNATDAVGWTALHYAFAEAHPGVIKTLLAHGADSHAKSRDEESPSDVAPRGFEYREAEAA